MTTITAGTEQIRSERWLNTGSLLMTVGAAAFVGYAVIFFVLSVRNVTGGSGAYKRARGEEHVQVINPQNFSFRITFESLRGRRS
jgi:hypothetical protein